MTIAANHVAASHVAAHSHAAHSHAAGQILAATTTTVAAHTSLVAALGQAHRNEESKSPRSSKI